MKVGDGGDRRPAPRRSPELHRQPGRQRRLTVGGDGTGTMLINGADVSVSGSDITVGDSKTGDGILTINVSTLDFDGEL